MLRSDSGHMKEGVTSLPVVLERAEAVAEDSNI